MHIVYSKHANMRIKGNGVSKQLLTSMIQGIPAFTGTIDWKFSNGYYVVLSQKNDVILVVTVGKGVFGRYGKHFGDGRSERKSRR